ncbi:MAG: CHRD domain-containing protein [Gaiellaceae bacterium]
MTRRIGIATVFVVGLAVVGLAAAGVNRNWSTHSNGSMEVPVRDSQGQSQAIFHLSKDGDALDFKLIASNIAGVTQSHIHCGHPGENGPVVVFLYGVNAAGISPSGVLNQGTITNSNVIARPSTAICPGGIADLDDVIEKMNTGGAYVNVHTIQFPGGEIRGDIK